MKEIYLLKQAAIGKVLKRLAIGTGLLGGVGLLGASVINKSPEGLVFPKEPDTLADYFGTPAPGYTGTNPEILAAMDELASAEQSKIDHNMGHFEGQYDEPGFATNKWWERDMANDINLFRTRRP